jgi:D-tyrosyl-tRNA(Tyr) deacylase
MPTVRAVVQRVSAAAVRVDGATVGAIERGLCVLLGVGGDDDPDDARRMAERLANLRIFEDEAGRMNCSVRDIGGSVLAVSNFTLMADTRRGRRPSFNAAAAPAVAAPLLELVGRELEGLGIPLATGRFGAHMDIDIAADGPVTLLLDTKESRRG